MEQIRPIENTDSLAEIKKFASRVLRRWHWVALSVGIAWFIAFLINRYETPVYRSNAAIITKKFEERGGSILPGMFEGRYFGTGIEIYQEIPILKSHHRIRETLKRLDFEINYFVEGNVKTTELYPYIHFKVELDSSAKNVPYNVPIFVDHIDQSQYRLYSNQDNLNDAFSNKTCYYGETCSFNGFKFKINRTTKPVPQTDYRFFFIVNRMDNMVSQYRGKLEISWRQQGSAILNINMQSPIPEKDLDFIKTYIDVVTELGLEEKNAQAINTVRFIDEHMGLIGDSLMNFLVSIDDYKLENRELIFGSQYVFEKMNELDLERAEIRLANEYYDYLGKYVSEKRNDEVFAPNLIGLDVPLLTQFVSELISIKLEDQVDKNERNESNPLVIRENERYERLEKNIYESIKNQKMVNNRLASEIDKKIAFYINSLGDYQMTARELTRLEKLFAMNENMFTLLLEKRTEARIAMASTTSDYEIVEIPVYNKIPVYPDKKKIFTIALLIGFGIPIGLIYLLDQLNDKIITRDDLQKQTSIPVVGHIGHNPAKSDLVIRENPKSVISESFRTIRANLQYFTGAHETGTNIYMVTSSISDEGKTFCSINLAFILAASGKKTLILGADMRRPSLARYFGIRNKGGLSNYLGGFSDLNDIMHPTETENLFVLLGGDVPPNPAELLGSARMKDLLKELRKKYDYIVIDTPPIGLVSDALELLRITDYNMLVVRQGRTVKSSLNSINELYLQGKIKNLGILFNDIDFRKLDYGYGYQYGYSYKYGYYYRYGYGYGYGYFDDDEKQNRNLFSRILKKKKKS